MNDILTGKLMKDCSSTVVVLYIIGVILRILLTALIAFMFFTNNMYSAFLFLLGYCLHFVSLIIISAKVLFAKEGK
jgi:dolichyl-phosphate-mannose--protein O-mannosyl transferase